MDIHLQKAASSGIILKAEFPGIADQDQMGSDLHASPLILVDESRIIQILLSLTSNALKFTSLGSVTITVSLEKEGGQEWLRVAVQDTGVGISQQDIPKLFRLFGFLEESEQLNSNGIGLGLVISKQLVEQFRGQIWCESTLDVGSTFTFTIKIEQEAL